MFTEFKDFVMRGNVLDMAVGIIIGSAFGAIIKSLVEDVIMPPIGLLLGGVDFTNVFIILKEGTAPKPYASLAAAQEVGAVTVNLGVFLNTIFSFLIVALAIFWLVRALKKLRKGSDEAPPLEVTAKECPFCFTEISIKANRCPNCTSEL